MRNSLQKKNGITQIALVITIVILIILAGVLINLTLGDNGLFTRTKLAKQKYEYAAAKEIVDVKLVDIQAECMTEGEEGNLHVGGVVGCIDTSYPNQQDAKNNYIYNCYSVSSNI